MNPSLDLEIIFTWLANHWVSFVLTIIMTWVIYLIGSKVLALLVHRAVSVNGKHQVWRTTDITKRQDTLVGLVRNIWRIVVIVTLIYALLRIIIPDISTTLAPLFASAGIIGIALGFGAQSLIKDFLSGIFIISENQYRVGDIIQIEEASGTVERIGSRSTMLRDVEGNVHFLPNGMIQHVINKTMDYSKARVTISVIPETDIERATALIDHIGTEMSEDPKWKDKILEAPAYVMMGELSATSVELIVSGKVPPSDQWSVSAELRRRILHTFEAKGIELGLTNSAVVASSRRR